MPRTITPSALGLERAIRQSRPRVRYASSMRTKQTKPKPKPKDTAPANAARTKKSQIKKQRFAEEYVAAGGDGKTAARKAGSKAKDTTKAANELLRDPAVQAEIKVVADASRSAKVLTAREVLERLSEQATFDPTPYMNKDGSVDLQKLQKEGKGHLIQGYDSVFSRITQTLHTKAFFYSHQKALFQLADCFGLRQAPKQNEFESVRNGVKAYMDTNQSTLQQAIEFLSSKYPVVSRYAGRLLEEGVLPS
jgi:Terminase small subunit